MTRPNGVGGQADKPALLAPRATVEEERDDAALRPRRLEEFVGQEKLKANLRIAIQASAMRKDSLDHCLFSGPPGLGKTTLAHILAAERGVNLRVTSGPALEKVGDLAAILSNLSPGDIFFIDEIHRLPRAVEEGLYKAMEAFHLDIIIGQGPGAREMELPLPRFTLVAATTRSGLLPAPLRERFGISEYLNFYTDSEMETIVARSARLLNLAIDAGGTAEVARRARRTPRVANRLLRRVRDYAQVKAGGVATREVAQQALAALEIDAVGLDPMDRRILEVIIHKFGGGPVGIETVATAVSEEADTLTDVHEPYLIQLGFLARTSRGRTVTEHAYRHLGLVPPAAPAAGTLL